MSVYWNLHKTKVLLIALHKTSQPRETYTLVESRASNLMNHNLKGSERKTFAFFFTFALDSLDHLDFVFFW